MSKEQAWLEKEDELKELRHGAYLAGFVGNESFVDHFKSLRLDEFWRETEDELKEQLKKDYKLGASL